VADSEQAGVADGDTEGTTCTDCWQATMSDVLKHMWAIYRESGIFLAVCHHGFIWLILDMIRSGEL
jgi:Kyakuja-Dileera-Zisupton transposase